jgi:hypothetical protein
MAFTHEQIKKLLSTGCSEEVFAEIPCPKCGGRITLTVHPNRRVYFVHCQAASTHLAMHGENPDPPEWWARHIDKFGWLS